MSAYPYPSDIAENTIEPTRNGTKPAGPGSVNSATIREDRLFVDSDGDFTAISTKNLRDRVPSGFYTTDTNRTGDPMLISLDYESRDLVRFPDGPQSIILEEIKQFNLLGQKYKEFGETHKRGFLLYGTPGTGKTVTIAMLMEYYMNTENHLALRIGDCFEFVLQELQDYNKLVVIEDLNPNRAETMLDFLDGTFQYQNLVVIATTNYIDQLPPSITQRPSRFDRVIEVGFPESKHREYYLKAKFPEILTKFPTIVQDTEKLSIAQLKELAIATLLYGLDYKETLIRMRRHF